MTLDKEAASPLETWAPTREKPGRLGTLPQKNGWIQSQKTGSNRFMLN